MKILKLIVTIGVFSSVLFFLAVISLAILLDVRFIRDGEGFLAFALTAGLFGVAGAVTQDFIERWEKKNNYLK